MGRVLTDVHVVGAAILAGGRCLVARRGGSGRHAGLWEFPGGKIEPGETPEAALRREIHEELGCRIHPGRHLGRGFDETGHQRVVLDVYEAALAEGPPTSREHDALLWANAADLQRLDWAPADVPIVAAVAARLTTGGGRSDS